MSREAMQIPEGVTGDLDKIDGATGKQQYKLSRSQQRSARKSSKMDVDSSGMSSDEEFFECSGDEEADQLSEVKQSKVKQSEVKQSEVKQSIESTLEEISKSQCGAKDKTDEGSKVKGSKVKGLKVNDKTNGAEKENAECTLKSDAKAISSSKTETESNETLSEPMEIDESEVKESVVTVIDSEEVKDKKSEVKVKESEEIKDKKSEVKVKESEEVKDKNSEEVQNKDSETTVKDSEEVSDKDSEVKDKDSKEVKDKGSKVNNKNSEKVKDKGSEVSDKGSGSSVETDIDASFRDSLTHQPDGRLRPCGELRLINGEDALYIPITQEPAPMTEDLLEEHAEVLAKYVVFVFLYV